jgi:Arc/MetJ-type ribon-helix-helix transcriptional regulator
METIQVVLEEDLLKAADRAVRKLKTNRSALIREALRSHLRRLDQIGRDSRDIPILSIGRTSGTRWRIGRTNRKRRDPALSFS